jgi:hypothetical protein
VNKLSSRKLWLAIILMIVFTVLVFFGKIGEDNYINAILWLYGVYAGTNVLTKFTTPKDSDKHE